MILSPGKEVGHCGEVVVVDSRTHLERLEHGTNIPIWWTCSTPSSSTRDEQAEEEFLQLGSSSSSSKEWLSSCPVINKDNLEVDAGLVFTLHCLNSSVVESENISACAKFIDNEQKSSLMTAVDAEQPLSWQFSAKSESISSQEHFHSGLKKKLRVAEVVSGKSQLDLAVYENCGLLTVHVKRAKRLKSLRDVFCNCYVKIDLLPGSENNRSCRTDVVKCSNEPHFDQKFSFEVIEGDAAKRLFISIWHRDFKQNSSELLGCMSFGLQRIISSKIDGWYRILTETIGRKKHFAVKKTKAVRGKYSCHSEQAEKRCNSINQWAMESYSSSASSCSVLPRPLRTIEYIESAITFTCSDKPFKLAMPGRIFIFEDTVGFFEEETNSFSMHLAMLFTDVLLLAKENPHTNSLTVSEQPIDLTSVIKTSFDEDENESQFGIVTRDEKTSIRSVILRAGSVDSKHRWKSVIKKQLHLLGTTEDEYFSLPKLASIRNNTSVPEEIQPCVEYQSSSDSDSDPYLESYMYDASDHYRMTPSLSSYGDESVGDILDKGGCSPVFSEASVCHSPVEESVDDSVIKLRNTPKCVVEDCQGVRKSVEFEGACFLSLQDLEPYQRIVSCPPHAPPMFSEVPVLRKRSRLWTLMRRNSSPGPPRTNLFERLCDKMGLQFLRRGKSVETQQKGSAIDGGKW